MSYLKHLRDLVLDKPKIDKIEKDYTDAFNQKEAFIQQIDIKNILDQFALTSHKIANSQYRQNMPKFEINDILECEVKNVPNSKVRLTMKKHKRTPLGAKIVSGVTPSGEIKHYAEEYCKKITSLQ